MYQSVGCFPRASSGSSSGQQLLCIFGVCLHMSSWLLLGSGVGVVVVMCFLVFPLPPLLFRGVGVLDLESGVVGGARGWFAGRAGLWGVPPTWVWVVGFTPQIREHPTSICDTGVKYRFTSLLPLLTF